MRSLMATSALALIVATGIASAQTSTTQDTARPDAAQQAQPKDTPAAETAKQPGAPNAPTSASDTRGGSGNPSPAQSAGPPEAGPTPLRGDGLDVPGATKQTAPAKFSKHNAVLAEYSIMGYPVQLDDKQRHAIWESVAQRGATKSAQGKTITEEPGTFLPALVQADEFPEALNKEIPLLRGLKYVKVDDKVLIVAPSNGIVRGVIEE
jgi:hypothetical protein